MKRVAIVGLGLIGGSIARALRERLDGVYLLGVDRDHVGARTDVQATISEFVALESVALKGELIGSCELVVLCQPVRGIVASVEEYLKTRTAVTDTGSTKRLIVERASMADDDTLFVPGHPMAGKALGGFEHATPDLFEGRPWILCPQGRDPSAVARVATLIETVGARRVEMSPEQHDAAVAVTSHVPQLLSSWLHRAASQRGALDAAGPAFREMTRTAGGAESIWQDIFETNADEVGRALRDAALALSAVADALLADPPRIERVLDLLREARISKGGNRTS